MISTDLSATSDPTALALHLMELDSTSGNESAVMARMAALLGSRGWQVTPIAVGDGRNDLLATTDQTPRITLSTHLDTVPPFIPPSRRDGRLAGRGACDAKGIAASMLLAAERLREAGHAVGLLFVVGEETCHDGAIAANAWAAANLPPAPRVLINGEPTESTLAVGTKGALRCLVRVTGAAAHSAYPQFGKSATRELVRLLARLDSLELPRDHLLGETTINIGSLSGGIADNVLAPSAEARLMVRLVTPPDEIVALMRAWALDADLEIGVVVPPVRLATLAGQPTSVAAFATDIPELGNWGTPYLYGPGSIHVAHTDHEFVEEAELRRAVEAYVAIAEGALARLPRQLAAS